MNFDPRAVHPAALFAVLAALWGGSFVWIEVGLDYFPPLSFAALRYDVAGLLVLAYSAATVDRWRPRGREWLPVAVTAVFVFAAYHGFLFLGIEHVSGAVAAVLIGLTPVLTAGFAAALRGGEGLDGARTGGVLLGFLGVAVVAGIGPAGFVGTSATGVLLVLAGAVAFALGTVLAPESGTLPLRTTQGWAMLGGAGLLHVWAGVRGESLEAVVWTPRSIAAFLYLTVLAGAVAFLVYFHLLAAVGPTELNLVGYVEPLVAAAVSWAVLGEVVGPRTFVGFACILAGFALVKHAELRRFVSGVRRAAGSV
ncbi:DMT family transporter [Halorarum halobium]|uniref:DMT family transporter n=1 Tax=Halorarum halobium TaxID=3075121 RepID=UPI0028A8B035|nr:DMT family transporter [Halobaculum sp. XH14]